MFQTFRRLTPPTPHLQSYEIYAQICKNRTSFGCIGDECPLNAFRYWDENDVRMSASWVSATKTP